MSDKGNHNSELTKGASLAFLGRLGALAEAVSLPVFAWLYGAPTLGIFFALWAALRVLTAVCEFAMTTSLQRFIPRAESDAHAGSIVRLAITVSLSAGLVIALLITLFAPQIAGLFNAAEREAPHLAQIIRIYAWVLPFWVMVEVLTASIRAKRAFGPEIRIRIFYEQGLRLLAGVGFFYLGYASFGLFYAHLLSVALASILALRLVLQHYDLRAGAVSNAAEILSFSAHMMPANLVKKLNSELPMLLLNMLLSGAAGAVAAAIFGVARKIASLLQVFRQSFEYVLAPFAAHKLANGQYDQLRDMYALSLRLTLALVIPIGFLVMALRHEILTLFSMDVPFAGWVLIVLATGRMIEGASGPSSAIVEMLGHKALPLLNGVLGIITLVLLQLSLVPHMGPVGAAIAAAAGLNVVSLLSLGQAIFLYRLNPFNRQLIKPIFFSLAGSLITLVALIFVAPYGNIFAGILSITGVLATILMVIRFGLSDSDRTALGPIGRIFAKSR